MLNFANDSKETVNHTEIKVPWNNVQETSYHKKNLSTQSWKVMRCYQFKSQMNLPKAYRVISNSFDIHRIYQKGSKGGQYGRISLKEGGIPEEAHLYYLNEYD